MRFLLCPCATFTDLKVLFLVPISQNILCCMIALKSISIKIKYLQSLGSCRATAN